MSKVIWVCSREKLNISEESRISNICSKLSPDNIVPAEPKIVLKDDVAYGILNPNETILIHDTSLLFGKIIKEESYQWYTPKNEYPEGSYALFRDNSYFAEIATDSVASRTIWYYFDDDIFIASTSQRAIVLYLGNFVFNEAVIPWVLSSGTLGPELSWDKRIKMVKPNSSIILDKEIWEISIKTTDITFEVKDENLNHESELIEVLKSNFDLLNLDINKWVLPLSGGYDSRGILCLLKDNDRKKIKTITWGAEYSVNDEGSDVFVAKKITNHFGIEHQYFSTDFSDEPIEEILLRFILNGEGRIDHISGYIDGFYTWKYLFENNIQGIIRGDEGFGWSEVTDYSSARKSTGIDLCEDYDNLKKIGRKYYRNQRLPQEFLKQRKETVEAYRDRLYHQFRLPIILGALSDLKLSYVELFNPLLFGEILNRVRELPDDLRTEKKLFKDIVNLIGPDIEFATKGSNYELKDILRTEKVKTIFVKELESKTATDLFPKELLDDVLHGLEPANYRKKGEIKLAVIMVTFFKKIKNKVRKVINKKNVTLTKGTYLDNSILAFRIFIILKMYNVLNEKI